MGPDRRVIGLNNIELISDRPLQINLDEIRRVKRAWPDRAMVVSLMVPVNEEGLARHPRQGGGHRRRRRGAELRLPAWHERTRHGLGGGPGAGVHPAGGGLVQAAHQTAGDRQADAQHHRCAFPGARGQGRRRRCGQPDQHHQLGDGRGPGTHGDEPGHRWLGLAWRLLRPGGEADRPEHGGRDRPRSADFRPADLRHWRHHAPGATRPSSSRWAAAPCRCAPRRWSMASRSSRTFATALSQLHGRAGLQEHRADFQGKAVPSIGEGTGTS